ncbi:MAG: hypothetical protein GXP49_02885 [Deltaproteobacteria bacterium]|nr:hypothetical protein [Deltaproteobacteria bacterium]
MSLINPGQDKVKGIKGYFRTLGTLVLIFSLSLPFGVSYLHLAFASHHHLYNPSTGSYEDIVVHQIRSSHYNKSKKTGKLRNGNEPEVKKIEIMVEYVDCSISNFFRIPRIESEQNENCGVYIGSSNHGPPFHEEIFLTLPILQFAPKLSPPSFS